MHAVEIANTPAKQFSSYTFSLNLHPQEAREERPSLPSTASTMATRTLEARFERMSVNDENDPGDGSRLYTKAKVRDDTNAVNSLCLGYLANIRVSARVGYCNFGYLAAFS
jgi:hypothetical protein